MISACLLLAASVGVAATVSAMAAPAGASTGVTPPPGVSPGRVARAERPSPSLDAALAQIGDAPRARMPQFSIPAPGSASESESARRYVRGRLRAIDGQPVRAGDDFDAALRLDPGSAALHAARAEAASQAGDLQRAAAEWEAVLALSPDDVQALIAVGVAANAGEEHARAAALLGKAWQHLRAEQFGALSDAGRATVGGALARSLFRTGFDGAGLEAARVALGASVERTAAQRGDGVDAAARSAAQLAREAGMAALRGGAPEAAAALLSRSVELVPEAGSAALLAYAQLSCGRSAEARATLALILQGEPWRDPARTAVAQWLLEALQGDADAAELLSAVALQQSLAAEGTTESTGRLARLEAAADPPRACELLRAAVRAGADDAATLEAALRACGDAAAPGLAAEAIARNPAVVRDAARALVRASIELPAMRTALEALPDGAVRESLIAAAQASMRACGEAWTRAAAASERWPDRREPLEAMLVAAVAAADPALVERAASLAPGPIDGDAGWHASVARAFSETGATRAAAREARRAVDLGGARGPDAARTGRILAEVHASAEGRAPEGSPRARAEDALPRADLATAVGELLLARAADRDDAAALGMLVRILPRTDGPRAAWEWTVAELDRTPNDPLLWEALVLQAISGGQAAEVLARVDARLAADPVDTLVLGAREALLRATGRDAEALLAARTRTQSLPPGPRRALEQAALEAQWGDAGRAVDALRAFSESAYPPPAALRSVALDLTRRLAPQTAGRAQVMRRIARDAILADADAPLEFYAFEALSAASDTGMPADRRAAAAAMIGAEAASRAPLRADAEPWRASADFLLSQGYPLEAGELVRARLDDPTGLDDAELALLARAAVACDAAAGGRAGESIALIARLRSAGFQPFPSEDQPAAAYDALSGIYSVVGDAAGAERILEAGAAVDPEDAGILNNLGYARIERGVLDGQTESLLVRADSLRPGDATILDSLGWLRYCQGRLADEGAEPGAVTLLTRAVQRSGRSTSAIQQEHLGDALWRSGDAPGAERAWREALRLAEGGTTREEQLAIVRQVFRRQLGLAAIDPGKYHDAHEGAVSLRARGKLDAIANGKAPMIARTATDAAPAAPAAPPAAPPVTPPVAPPAATSGS